jgi:endoglycosylceramidase
MFQPMPTQYNETYLDALEAVVNKVGKHGLLVLLDMHQDALSEKYCGTGFPDWAVQPAVENFPQPLNYNVSFPNSPTYHPTRVQCDSIDNNNFNYYYVSFAESSAWGKVYAAGPIRTAFAAFWAHVAQRFVNNPHVLGYELMVRSLHVHISCPIYTST